MAQRPQVFAGTLTLLSSGAVSVGEIVVSGDSVLVALTAATAASQAVTYRLLGRVDDLPCAADDDIGAGDILYYDGTELTLSADDGAQPTPAAYPRAGRAACAATTGVAVVDCLLGT